MKETYPRTLDGKCPEKEKGCAGRFVLKGKGKHFEKMKKALLNLEEKEPCLKVTIKESKKKHRVR